MDAPLFRLQNWYTQQCNGDWEHGSGVHIETLDNPGWRIRINVESTPLENRPFDTVEHGLTNDAATDWHRVWVKDNRFEGAGDPSKLVFLLKSFLDWADNHRQQ